MELLVCPISDCGAGLLFGVIQGAADLGKTLYGGVRFQGIRYFRFDILHGVVPRSEFPHHRVSQQPESCGSYLPLVPGQGRRALWPRRVDVIGAIASRQPQLECNCPHESVRPLEVSTCDDLFK